jgi:PBP1b-binding outer membrane lipoprotein LpoB
MKSLIILFCVAVLLAGCSSSSQPQPQSGETDKGREETKKLEGASAVGYDGKAIRKSVDNSLNKNDDHNRDLDKANKPDSEK